MHIPKEEWIDLQKLDFNTKRDFETERDPTKRPSLEEYFEFLDKRCAIVESVVA